MEEINKVIDEKVKEFSQNTSMIRQMQVDLLSLYFGKVWIDKIFDWIMSLEHVDSINNIYKLYDESGNNSALLPTNKQQIFVRFCNVHFDKIKAVLLADRPGVIESILETDDLSPLEKQGVFILTHELTACNHPSHKELHDGSPWREFTTKVHGLLIDFDVIEVNNSTTKEQLIQSLNQEGIKW